MCSARPQAQRTGQRIGNIPTAALAARFGPIPMDDGDPWTLELVESNRLELSYTNTAPGFATNTYVCNLTPARPEDIFNRKITGISDDPGNKRLTLFTVEVPLTEIATNGAASSFRQLGHSRKPAPTALSSKPSRSAARSPSRALAIPWMARSSS